MRNLPWLLLLLISLSACAGTTPSADKAVLTKVEITIEDNTAPVHFFMSPDLGFTVDAGQSLESLSEQNLDVDPAAVGTGTGSALGSAVKAIVK